MPNGSKLECLAIKGNYFVERNPAHRSVLINYFSGLRELDSVQITPVERQGEIPACVRLRAELLPFAFKLDSKLQVLSESIKIGKAIDNGCEAMAVFSEITKEWAAFDKCTSD